MVIHAVSSQTGFSLALYQPSNLVWNAAVRFRNLGKLHVPFDERFRCRFRERLVLFGIPFGIHACQHKSEGMQEEYWRSGWKLSHCKFGETLPMRMR